MAGKRQVISRERVVEHGEVFTAERQVCDMLDMVNICERTDCRVLEPACGDGNFLAEILKRKLTLLKKNFANDPSGYEINAVTSICNMYGIDILADNVRECRKRLLELWKSEYISICKDSCKESVIKAVREILKNNIVCGNSLSQSTVDNSGNDTGKPIFFQKWNIVSAEEPQKSKQNFAEMLDSDSHEFDVIVSNPPYQQNDGGAGASAKPLYHEFIRLAKKLNPRYMTMIVPSRWFAGGKGLDSFRDEMLHDDRIRILHDYPDASDCFPNVEIKGGVCYFLWDRDNRGDCEVITHRKNEIVSRMTRPLLENDCEIFIRDNNAIGILKKVKALNEVSISTVVSPRKPFAFPTNFKDFSPKRRKKSDLTIYANHEIGYIERSRIERNTEWIDMWKVFVPEAIGSGSTATDRVNPIAAGPRTVCTETYLVFGPCKSEAEANNLCAYISTKFFHFMLGLKKITQHTTSKVYEFVPIEDLSIKWTDELLYKKYKLTKREIEYIEKSVWNSEK